ncbi:MAG: hypothetical protein ACLGI3_02745 [Actinomycetes bacterium]
MPLGLGIVDVLRAIPPRIEVAGHGPTIRITAGSFDAALDYARQRLRAPTVLDGTLRHRFWPRVTLTVTTDPELAATAPPLEELRARIMSGAGRGEPVPDPAAPDVEHRHGVGLSVLEEIFADQEWRREAHGRIPAQRVTSD